jgi:hypothetical protein
MHRIALVDAVTSDRAYSVAKAKRELERGQNGYLS